MAPGKIHLRPTAELAERVLLPGDPGRALAMAQAMLRRPRMFNHNRGLWGYTGESLEDGLPLSIQSTGMGGPSAAIVAHELIELGARVLVRVGTCGALAEGVALGDLVLARAVLADDGTSLALGAAGVLAADRPVTEALSAAAAEVGQGRAVHEGTVVSTDLFYVPEGAAREGSWQAAKAIAVEMEAATIFRTASLHGAVAACLLVVAEVRTPAGRVRIDDEALLAAVGAMGSVVGRGLAA